MAQHNPNVVVWDVSCPYYVNWSYLQHVRSTPDFAGRVVIVTTPNVERLNDAVGAPVSGAIELVGNPHDLELLLECVRRACESLPTQLASADD
jgi:DNA-binding NtrC family response regulator